MMQNIVPMSPKSVVNSGIFLSIIPAHTRLVIGLRKAPKTKDERNTKAKPILAPLERISNTDLKCPYVASSPDDLPSGA